VQPGSTTNVAGAQAGEEVGQGIYAFEAIDVALFQQKVKAITRFRRIK
jgi:hypothetical protein